MEAGEEREESQVRQLIGENIRLKRRVFELEEEIRRRGPATGSKDSTKMIKLLEQKDQTLGQYAEDLQRSRDELKTAVEELQRRNEQLQLWMSTLRLYQEFFETEPSAMVALNKDGKVVLYNRTAVEIFGEKFKETYLKDIESFDFESFDPTIPAFARETIAGKRPLERTVKVRGRRVTSAYFMLGSGTDVRGALIKVSVIPER